MKQKTKKLLCAVAVCAAVGCPAFAGQPTAEFSLKPETGSQDGKVWYELVYENGSNSTAGAAFYLQVSPQVTVTQVQAGEDVETSEISYNNKDGKLVLLYVDNDTGESVPKKGDSLFRICVEGSDSRPFVLEETDVCAVLSNNEIVQVETTLNISAADLSESKPNATAVPDSSQSLADSDESSKPQQTAAPSSGADSQSKPQSSQNADSGSDSTQAAESHSRPQESSAAGAEDSQPQQTTPTQPTKQKNNSVLAAAILLCSAGLLAGGLLWKKHKNKQ